MYAHTCSVFKVIKRGDFKCSYLFGACCRGNSQCDCAGSLEFLSSCGVRPPCVPLPIFPDPDASPWGWGRAGHWEGMGEAVVGSNAQMQTHFWRCARRIVNTLRKEVLELDVKSPELSQKASVKHTRLRRRARRVNTDKQTRARTHPELSSLTVSPRYITLSGMQGGGSPQQAQHNAQSQERLRGCVFATRDGGGEIVCVMHLDLFWHTYNYSAHLLQELLNVAWKVLKMNLEVEEEKWVTVQTYDNTGLHTDYTINANKLFES